MHRVAHPTSIPAVLIVDAAQLTHYAALMDAVQQPTQSAVAPYPVCCSTHCCPMGSYCCGSRCCHTIRGRSAREIPGEEKELVIYSTEAIAIVHTIAQLERPWMLMRLHTTPHLPDKLQSMVLNCSLYARMQICVS